MWGRSLQQRMLIGAQYGKQRALAQLRRSFLAQRLAPDTPDAHHRVLLLLLRLARRPLDSAHAPGSLLTPAALEGALCFPTVPKLPYSWPSTCAPKSHQSCLQSVTWGCTSHLDMMDVYYARSGAGDEEADACSSDADELSAWGDERLGSGSDLSDWSGSGSGGASPHGVHMTNGKPTPVQRHHFDTHGQSSR